LNKIGQRNSIREVELLQERANRGSLCKLFSSGSGFIPSLGGFLFLFVCFSVLMSLLVYGAVTGAVSPRLFGLCGIVLMLGLFIGFAYRLRSAHATEGSQNSIRSFTEDSVQVNLSIKRLRIAIGVMLLLLLNGLWFTRGGPLLPRLVGVTINLFITASFVFRLRRAKKLLAPGTRNRTSSY